MRILHVCNKIPFPNRDGGSIAIFNAAHSFSRLGHDVTILSMLTAKHNITETDRLFLESFARLYTVYVFTETKWPFLLKNFFFTRIPLIAARFISGSFRKELIHVLQSYTFDIVQLEGAYLLPYIKTIREHSRATVAFRSHNIEHIIWRGIAKWTRNPFKKIYLKNLSKRLENFEKEYINRYDLLIPITEVDKRAYINMGNQKPASVYNAGYDTNKLSTVQPAATGSSLFFLGSMDWTPNQQGLCWFTSCILPDLCKTHPNLLFYVAGRNAPAFMVDKMKHSNIVFCGEVQDSREFIEKMGIMVVPLFSGSGMRIKIIEAMALGRPVVATSKAAEGIDITPDENILLADRKDDFRKQTEKLLSDAMLCDKIGQNAAKLIREKYDSMQISNVLAEFYQKNLS